MKKKQTTKKEKEKKKKRKKKASYYYLDIFTIAKLFGLPLIRYWLSFAFELKLNRSDSEDH